jgi:hypothetical protein
MLRVVNKKLKACHSHLGDLMSLLSAARLADRLSEILNLLVVKFEQGILILNQLLSHQSTSGLLREP